MMPAKGPIPRPAKLIDLIQHHINEARTDGIAYESAKYRPGLSASDLTQCPQQCRFPHDGLLCLFLPPVIYTGLRGPSYFNFNNLRDFSQFSGITVQSSNQHIQVYGNRLKICRFRLMVRDIVSAAIKSNSVLR